MPFLYDRGMPTPRPPVSAKAFVSRWGLPMTLRRLAGWQLLTEKEGKPSLQDSGLSSNYPPRGASRYLDGRPEKKRCRTFRCAFDVSGT
jgi:hypothetical protein